MKKIIVLLLAILVPTMALAQSTPNLVFGQVPTAAQWNSYFAAKQDVLGYSPVSKAGDTMSGRLILAPSTTARPGLNYPVGVAPTSPSAGDIWSTSAGLYGYFNSSSHWLSSDPSQISFTATDVNFNSVADTSISVSLPPSHTRYLVNSVRVSGASVDLSSAHAGVFTAASAGGVTVVSDAALTVVTASDATVNNSEAMTIIDADTRSYTLSGVPTLFFHVGTAVGSPATGDVTISITPLP